MTLEQFFRENPKVAVAFSGGVDSAYLLYAASKFDADVKGYYVKTAFQPAFELADAERLAKELRVEFEILPLDILDCKAVTEKANDRCYHCKKAMFSAIWEKARQDGYPVLLDGTNASDDAADRPGMAAIRELAVRSPLRECGLTKSEIRYLSEKAGLFTYDKPAYACLATRIPTGEPITREKLERTERAERYLASLGLRDFRVRTRNGGAVLQVTEQDLPLVLSLREKILVEMKKNYDSVVMDLEVRA